MDYKALVESFQKLMEDTITSRNQATLAAFATKIDLLEHSAITEGVKACLSTFKIEREKFENSLNQPSVISPQVTEGEVVEAEPFQAMN